MAHPTQEQLTWIQRIHDTDGDVPAGMDPCRIARELLPLLGSTDGELRERKVLGILYAWITRRVLTDEQIRGLAFTLADDDHLFLDIGQPKGDSAYMRAFSALMLSVLVGEHRKAPLFSLDELRDLKRRTVRYLDEERDLRGYVSSETWWVHGVAHGADVVRELCRCGELGRNDLVDLLACAARAMTTESAVYTFEEEARMAAAAICALKRNALADEDIASWLASLIPEARFTGTLPLVHHRYVNARNFLRALYHQGRAARLPADLLERILDAHDRLPER